MPRPRRIHLRLVLTPVVRVDRCGLGLGLQANASMNAQGLRRSASPERSNYWGCGRCYFIGRSRTTNNRSNERRSASRPQSPLIYHSTRSQLTIQFPHIPGRGPKPGVPTPSLLTSDYIETMATGNGTTCNRPRPAARGLWDGVVKREGEEACGVSIRGGMGSMRRVGSRVGHV